MNHTRIQSAMIRAVSALALFGLASPLGAATFYVPADYGTIQACIDAATNGDECIVAPATYFERIDFIGKAITVRSSAGVGPTIIDGTGLGGGVVTCTTSEGSGTVLDGFTITGGTGSPCTAPNSNRCGGGMLMVETSPTVKNCSFRNNSAQYGGGIYKLRGAPTFINCKFRGNSSNTNGGAIYARRTSLHLKNCVFSGNTAGTNGAAIYNHNCSARLTNCSLTANSASNGNGGGMYNSQNSDPVITNSILWGNVPNEIRNSGSASTPTVSYSYVQGDLGEFTINGGNNPVTSVLGPPLFARDPDPGENGWDGLDDDYGNLRLGNGSPCIDVGTNNAVGLNGVSTDHGNSERFRDDPETNNRGNGTSPIVDMGAFEFGGIHNVTQDTYHGSIQAALPGMGSYDVIVVAPGRYNETITSSESCFTLRSSDGAAVTVLDGGGLNDSVVSSSFSDTLIDGFTITGGTGSPCKPGSGRFLGGGICAYFTSLTIANCILIANTAESGGGMFIYGSSRPTILNTSFLGNTATVGAGGGIAQQTLLGRGSTVTGCAFVGNSAATDGGGMLYNISGSLQSGTDGDNYVTNNTFSENYAGNNGGGFASTIKTNDENVRVRMDNCILWGNTAEVDGHQIYHDMSLVFPSLPDRLIISYCGIKDSGGSSAWDSSLGVNGGNNSDADPVFNDVDGADDTLGTTDDDVRLDGTVSPYIDAGNNDAQGLQDVMTDLDGNDRFVDAYLLDLATVDLGAYELQELSVIYLANEIIIPPETTFMVDQSESGPATGYEAKVFYHGDEDKWFTGEAGRIVMDWRDSAREVSLQATYVVAPEPDPNNTHVSRVTVYGNSPWSDAQGRNDNNFHLVFRWNNQVPQNANGNAVDDIRVTNSNFVLDPDTTFDDGDTIVLQYDDAQNGPLVGFEVLTFRNDDPVDTIIPIGRRIVVPVESDGSEAMVVTTSSTSHDDGDATWQDGTKAVVYPIRPVDSFSDLRVVWYHESEVLSAVDDSNTSFGRWPAARTRHKTVWPEEVSRGAHDLSQINVIDTDDPVSVVDLGLLNGDYTSVNIMYEENLDADDPDLASYPVNGDSITEFGPTTERYSVLKFECGTACEDVVFETVKSVDRLKPEVFDVANDEIEATVGTPIEPDPPTLHESATPNFPHGYLHDGQPFAPLIYTETGQIIPVNSSNLGGSPPEHGVLEVWYFEKARTTTDGNFADAVRWPYRVHTYDASFPASPSEIIIASRLGAGPDGIGQGSFLPSAGQDPSGVAQAFIYKAGARGDDATARESIPGWNPNDEHASLISIGGNLLAFATRDDNPWVDDFPPLVTTGHPYVLVQHRDNPGDDWSMDVLKVVAEDVGQKFTFSYSEFLAIDEEGAFVFNPVVAGLPLNPPLFPLNRDIPTDPLPCGVDPNVFPLPVEIVDKVGLWEDRTGQVWIISNQPDTIKLHEKWGRDNDFDCNPWLENGPGGCCLDGSCGADQFLCIDGEPWPIDYLPSWPGICSGQDGGPGPDDDLPCARNYAIGFTRDVSAACSLDPALYDDVGIRLIDPTMVFATPYSGDPLPDFALLPPYLAAGKDGELGTFPEDRIRYESLELKFTGIMSDEEYADLTSASLWAGGPVPGDYVTAIDALKAASREQLAHAYDVSLLDAPHVSLGSSDAQEGYATIALNDSPACIEPVVVEVWHAACPPQQPQVKMFVTACPFGEAVVLKVDHDAGGNPDSLAYHWQYREIGDPEWTDLILTPGQEVGLREWTITGAFALTDKTIRVRYRGYGNCACDNETDCIPEDTPWPYRTSGAGYDYSGTEVTAWSPEISAQGWLKRLVGGLNAFDSRISDFHDPAGQNFTYSTMIEQAGKPYDGTAILSCDPLQLQKIGLIEAYETSAERVELFTTAQRPATTAENLALLFITARISKLHMLLGNEALADSADPTIGFDPGFPGDPGSVPSALFAFKNLVDNPLEEELALLRGVDVDAGFPLNNRLRWNVDSNDDAEVFYISTYNITDKDGDGFFTLGDAQISFPHGHGDAWGHFLTAIKKYYRRLRDNNFEWIIATETIPSGTGSSTPVAYQYERKFAEAAAAKAKTGAKICDLTFRERFTADVTSDPSFPDTDVERAWGVAEWATRAGQGAYFDWAVANALLDDDDSEHEGIERVDRTTVPELDGIASSFARMQATVNNAGVGVNPLGLATNVVPFGINANALAEGVSHYEQVRCWAVTQLRNAKTLFDYANANTRRLRNNEDNLQAFSTAVGESEFDYKQRLIEIFGRPYQDDIGPNGTYPPGYDGADIINFGYMDPSPLLGLTDFAGDAFTTTLTRKLDFDDFSGTIFDPTNTLTIDVEFNVSTVGLGLIPKPGWTRPREEPGEIQLAMTEVVQAIGELQQSIEIYNAHLGDIDAEIAAWEDLTQLHRDILKFKTGFQDTEKLLNGGITAFRIAAKVFEHVAEIEWNMADALAEAIPENAGTTVSVGAVAKGALKAATVVEQAILLTLSTAAETSASALEGDLVEAATQLDIEITTLGQTFAESTQLGLIEELLRQTPAIRLEAFLHIEALRQAQGRYQRALGRGNRLLDELASQRRKFAATATDYRYRDFAFRVLRNESLQKYRAAFDMAARYVYLAAQAFDYETNVLGSDPASAQAFLAGVLKQRTLGVVPDAITCDGNSFLPAGVAASGLADLLGNLDQQFFVIRQNEFTGDIDRTFGLREQLFDISAGDDSGWRTALTLARVDDLADERAYRLYASQFAFGGVDASIVIPFPTTVTQGLNFFGKTVSGPGFPADRYAIKLRTFEVRFQNLPAELNPFVNVYLIPVGSDIMRAPTGLSDAKIRVWNLIDQTLPPPIPVGGEFGDAAWQPWDTWTASPGSDPTLALKRRRIPSIGACDPLFDTCDVSQALVGRSAWNSSWVLMIPGSSLSNSVSPAEAVDIFIGSDSNPGVSDIELALTAVGYNRSGRAASDESSGSEVKEGKTSDETEEENALSVK